MFLIDPYRFGDPDAQSYIAAVETADGAALETTVKDAISAFVVGCKTDGTWTAIKACCILAGAQTLAGALVPLTGQAPTSLNFLEVDYNRKTGLIGNGSTKYLNSNRNSNADPQNNTHIAVHINAQSTGIINGNYLAAGSYNIAGSSALQTSNNNSQMFSRSRNQTGFAHGSKVTGFFGLSRNTSTAYARRFSGATATQTSTSQTPINDSYYVFRGNSSDPGFTNARIAYYSIGESLDLSLLDSRVTTLINAFAAAIP